MSVIQFPTRRPAAPSDELICECGGMWFQPVRVQPDGAVRPGAVLLTVSGEIHGYAGVMRCMDCGNDYKP